MIVATITALILIFGGGGTLEHYLLDIKQPVKAAVESKATVSEVVDLSKGLGKQLKAGNKEITKLKESFLDLHTNYDATLADFETTIDQLMASREEGQKDILDTCSAMKDLMTKEEWTEVFSLKDG